MPPEDSRVRAMADALPALVFVTDAAGDNIFTNLRFQQYTGRSPEALLDGGWLEIVHPQDRPRAAASWRRAMGKLKPYESECRIRRHDGQYRWHLCRAEPRLDESGAVLDWCGTCTDIEEHKRGQAALQESEQRARAALSRLDNLVHNSPWGIALFDENLQYVDLNEPAALADGISRDAHIGKTVPELLPEMGHKVEALLRQVRDDGCRLVGIELTGETPAQPGVQRHWLASYFPVKSEDGRTDGVGAVAVEVSEARRAERDLHDQHQKLSTLLETLPVGVMFAHDPECRRITGNQAAAKLLHMPADANISKSASDIADLLPFRIFKNGTELSADALPMQRAARGEVILNEELTFRFVDGTTFESMLSARPLYDGNGDLTGAVATILDTTELKRAEQELRDNDRRKDEFLAMLAHELRNPLAPIRTGLDVMASPDATPAMIVRAREMMRRQVAHLVHLVDDLLEVSRITRGKITLQPTAFDLSAVIEAATEIVAPQVSEHSHKLILELAEPAPLSGDLQRLTQALSNVLTNAIRYTPSGGRIWLTTEVIGGAARVRVKDTGIGIAPEHLEEVFGMFSRVGAPHEGDGGLGIGLALTKEIVALHGGTIEAKSEGEGKGSEFILNLPLHAADDACMNPTTEEHPSRGPARRVLVVDDNVDAADAMSILLRLEGHVVEVVNDGPAALAAIESFRPEVVLLDIGLPGMHGYEVAKRIRRLPDADNVLLVAVTGWGQENDRRRARDAGFDAHLTKPVDSRALQRTLTTFKDQPSGEGVAP